MRSSVRSFACLPAFSLLFMTLPALAQAPSPPEPGSDAAPAAGQAPAFNPAEAILRAEIDKLVAAGNGTRCQSAAVLLREKRFKDALAKARECLWEAPEESSDKLARAVVCLARAELPNSAPPAQLISLDSTGKPAAPVRVESSVTAPELLFRLSPQYSEESRKAHLEGTVTVESIIDEDGCVVRPEVKQSASPDLDKLTLEALRHWAFRPAMYQGKPVKVFYSLTVNFKAEDPPRP